MEKPKNWDNVEASKEFGDYESLKLGGHEVIIKKAYEYTGMTSGNTSLKIEVDIAGNDEQKGFYQKQYDNNTSKDKKWSNGAIKYVSLKEDEKCVAMFKGFITTLENSNKNFKWDFDESKLVGLKLVGVFGLEEYKNEKGEVKTATKLTQFRSLDKLKEVRIPNVKLLNNTYISYDDYMERKENESDYVQFDSNVEITEDLPF